MLDVNALTKTTIKFSAVRLDILKTKLFVDKSRKEYFPLKNSL